MARTTVKRAVAKRSASKPSSATSSRPVRQRRDFDALERRRRKAAKLFAKGVPRAEVARRLNVSRQSVSRWHQTWREQGEEALVDAARAGRPPRLAAEQKKRVDAELRKGPGAHGYATELWTLARVAEVIERITGVRYHPGHVWQLLRELGWSRQRPARRAVERDEEAIARWIKQDWPRVKKRAAPQGVDRLPKTNPAFRLFCVSQPQPRDEPTIYATRTPCSARGSPAASA